MIYPTNAILEGWIFARWKASRRRTWLKNLSRSVVCVLASLIAVQFYSKLDKFLALLGAVLCAPLALTIPSLLHLKQVAKTRRARLTDKAIIIFSVILEVLSIYQSLANWGQK